MPPERFSYAARLVWNSWYADLYGPLLRILIHPPVTHQIGTSFAKIEKAYMRFIPQALQEKLAGLKAKA
jgi:hypothetical protein